MIGREVGGQDRVPRVLDGAHHAVAADGDQAGGVAQVDLRRGLGVGQHRLHDVADECPILWPPRLDTLAGVDGPDDLIGARLDLVALEDVGLLLVAGEVDDLAAVFLEGAGDGEEHGVAEASAGQEDGLVVRDLRGRAGGAHHHDRLSRPERRAEAR